MTPWRWTRCARHTVFKGTRCARSGRRRARPRRRGAVEVVRPPHAAPQLHVLPVVVEELHWPRAGASAAGAEAADMADGREQVGLVALAVVRGEFVTTVTV